jgi:hypothetical protein
MLSNNHVTPNFSDFAPSCLGVALFRLHFKLESSLRARLLHENSAGPRVKDGNAWKPILLG